MLEVELYKIVDAGHFWCKPSSRNKTEAEKYYTLIGKINDYCCKLERQVNNQNPKIPQKGQICLVKRTSDRCWYRAKVLSIFQTINGPQARVLLVDLGERTLVPGIWVLEIPEEFLNIPYQTMECLLSGLKPLTMVTSYFDLTTNKQPGEKWDISATEWFKKQIAGCTLQLDVKHIDDDGVHHVLLFATGSHAMVCLNDELVNKEYAVLSKSVDARQDKKQSSSSKDHSQDSFSEELKVTREKLQSSLSFNGDSSVSSDQPLTNDKKPSKYQPLTWSEESEGSGNELRMQPMNTQSFSSDEDRSKVRFMSSRLPANGCSRSYHSSESLDQPKPILKNSSGYSSCEDSKDLFCLGELSKPMGGPPGGLNPAYAHEQNLNLPGPRQDVSSTSNFQNSQQFSLDTSRRIYSPEELPKHVKEPWIYSSTAHDHNADLTFQAQNLSSHVPKVSSAEERGQKLAKASWNFSQQNEMRTPGLNQGYPIYSTSQPRPPLPGNYQKDHGFTYQRLEENMNNKSSDQMLCPPFSQQNTQSFGSSLHQPVSTHQNLSRNVTGNVPPAVSSLPQSTSVPSGREPSPYNIPSTHFPNCQSITMQSTSIHHKQQLGQNAPNPTSCYVPITTSQSYNHPTNTLQSTHVPPGQSPLECFYPRPTPQSRDNPTNIMSLPSVPKGQVQSTFIPQSQVQQQTGTPRQQRYTPISTSVYPLAPTNQPQSSHVLQGQQQQQICPTRQIHYTPISKSEYPSVPTNQGQATRVLQSQLQEQNYQTTTSPYSSMGTSGYVSAPTYQEQSKSVLPLKEQYPARQPHHVSANKIGSPVVYSSQALSTGVPHTPALPTDVPRSQAQQQNFSPGRSQYVPISTSEYSYVPSNQAQSTDVYPSMSQHQHSQLPSNQSQRIPSNLSEDPPTSKLSQTVSERALPQQSTNAPTGMPEPLDILNEIKQSQHLPIDVTSSRVPSNQAQSHSHTSSTHSNVLSPITTSFIQTNLTPSQCVRSNLVQSSCTSSSTQHRIPTSPAPKSAVQSSTIQSSPTKSPRIPASPIPNAKLCHVSKDILIHGEGLPQSLTEIDCNTFPEGLQRGLRDLCVTRPSSFQANVWPSIIRGRDVFAIPETSLDNAMAYLPPVITQLAEPAVYSELPPGNGAFALIVCEGWRKATAVYECCRKLTKNVRSIRVQIVYGAGAEDECIPSLINGCEVLIATLPCLLRMLKMKVTRLDRLCHLVFDDADILAEEQTECVKEFMRDYGALLASQPNRLAPRQCIAIGNKWTTGVCSLVKAYLGNPLIVIGNQIEAAMLCKVRQIVNYVSSSKRESELLGLLDKYTINNEHEVIIFTSAAKDAERLAQMLHCYSFTILLAHEFLWPEKLTEIRRQWNTPRGSDSFLILVMTDGVIDKCNIKTATCVIHYDSPPSRKLFGKRLFCMAASYPSTKEKECLSLTIGTEHSTGCARAIKELALRSSGVVSPTLEKVCEYSYQEKEEKKKKDDLCSHLKAFGECKNLLECKSRHTVFPDVDVSALLPKSGIVKVLILAVLDASRYFVRILEHQSETEKEKSTANYYSGATFLKLALDLNSMYSSRENRHVCARNHPQKLCVVELEGSYHRAKVIRVVRADPETNRALEVQVYFMDRGFYENIPTNNLFEIAPQFVDIPCQAVEAYVCRVKPFDNDKYWTNKAVRFVKQHVEGQELEGRVIMGLRNTIWLDPLVAKTHLKEINVTTNTFNVRLDLLKKGLGMANQLHVENLKKHFSSFVELKDVTGRDTSERSSDPDQVETCTLPDHDYEMVRVSAVVNPELLYVRLDVNSNSLEDLVDEINDDIETRASTSHEDPRIGSLCLAKFTDDERWYRAKILSFRPEMVYDVFFVDYGDREWVSQDRIAPMRPHYLKFPFQAIECSLVNISPAGIEWTDDDAEALWSLTENKLLFAKVKWKSAAMLAGTCRYGIELCDTSTERDVHVNHELVVAGHAQATLEYHKTLFPEAFKSNDTGQPKEQCEEIPTLCLQLYQAQDPNTKSRFAQEIKNIVSENMKRQDDIRESGGIRCLCRLLGVTKHEAAQVYMIITLASLATQNDLNCDEIRREGGLKILCDLLTKATNVKVQEHCAWALKSLATSERNRDATREAGGIKNLCDLLATTDHEKVQENICWAIVSLCSDSNNNCDAIREAGGLGTLFTLLETSRNNFVLENTIWAISILSYNASNKKLIGEQGGIERICNLIKTNQDEKILQNAVRSLKTLSSYNDENREIMCRLGIIDLMRRLSNAQTQLPFDTRRTCLDLIQRLLGRAPDVPLIEASSITSPLKEPIKSKPISVTKKRKPTQENGKIVNGDLDSDADLPLLEDANDMGCPSVHPMTMWSQTKRFVSLSIKLRGVQSKSSNITEKNFYFKTKHMEKLYELNLDLFADVIPKESKVLLRGSEVLVNLKKAQQGIWKRLLSTKEKPPFLSIDFDRWDTDSGSDEETEIKRPKVRSPTKRETKIAPRPFDDDPSESSDLSDEEDTRERIGLDFA